MQKILDSFPPSTQNNARSIVRGLLERFIKKPSYGLEKRLNSLGVGVNWSNGGPDDITRAEEFYLLEDQILFDGDPNQPW
jgi:hypothetical protein